MGCSGDEGCAEEQILNFDAGDWREERISLGCFSEVVDFANVSGGISIAGTAGSEFAIADIRLVASTGSETLCETD